MKFSSLLNLILIAVTFLGLYYGQSLRTEQKRLREEFASLSSSYGEFSQEKKSLPQIIRLDTNEPMVFQWRVYLPAGYTGEVIGSSGRGRSTKLGHSMPWNHPAEFLVTQNFEVRSGEVRSGFGANSKQVRSIRSSIQCTNWVAKQAGPVNYTSGQGNGRPLLLTVAGSEFIVDHWDEFDFEAADANGIPSAIDEEISLLKVTIPEELMKEYLLEVGSRKRKNKNVLKNLFLKIKKVK